MFGLQKKGYNFEKKLRSKIDFREKFVSAFFCLPVSIVKNTTKLFFAAFGLFLKSWEKKWPHYFFYMHKNTVKSLDDKDKITIFSYVQKSNGI